MKWINTLRARFALWIAGLFLLVLIAFSIYIYTSMKRDLYAALDGTLSLTASQLIASQDIVNGQLVLAEDFAAEPESINLMDRGFTIRIFAPDGQILKTLESGFLLPSLPERLAAPVFSTVTDSPGDFFIRVYSAPVKENGQVLGFIQVAQSLQQVQNTLRQLLASLLLSVPFLVIIAGFTGYWLAARALEPIDRITRTARRISAEELSDRLNLPFADDEVGRLAQTFDEMLARLADSFRRERQFTADASHELRTPLTAMNAILSTTRQKRRTVQEYEQAISDLSEETERLLTLSENLLRLTRHDASRRLAPEIVDLTMLLSDVTESLRPLADEKALMLRCNIPDELKVAGNQDDLIRLFVNLIGNAIQYTQAGSVIVFAVVQEHLVKIMIQDSGIGISSEDLPHIFDRFYRVDKSRTSHGSGLGLAIALDMAQAHGGTIRAASVPGEGTTMEVCLPLIGTV